MTLEDLDWSKGRKAVAGQEPRKPAHIEERDGPPLSGKAKFDYILESIGYNPEASVDIGDPEESRRFFEYWAKKKIAMRKEAADGSQA